MHTIMLTHATVNGVTCRLQCLSLTALVVDAALLSDHANCSSSFLMLPLLSILFSLFLILCLILALILFTLWIRQHKRAFLQTTDKGKQRVKFHCNTDVSGEHSQATHDNRNTYEPPACINGSSVLYESVYLQTFFDESSVEDNLTTVVTSLSYPITSSEQWIILDDQSCHMIHENTYATPLDPNKAELQQQQHSFELEDSSGTVSGIQSCDGKYL